MVNGIIGKKLGMTQVFAPDGTVTPVTVIKAGPCVVVQRKTVSTDGYDAVQLGFVEEKAPRNTNKPMQGHFQKAGIPPTRILREIRLDDSADTVGIGDKVLVDLFTENDLVEVIGTSKGRGFAGFIKRHNFAGGRATHGSMFHRRAGLDWRFGLSIACDQGNANGGPYGRRTQHGQKPQGCAGQHRREPNPDQGRGARPDRSLCADQEAKSGLGLFNFLREGSDANGRSQKSQK